MEFERRFYPRVSLCTDIKLTLPNTSIEYVGNSINLSLTGIQIEINKSTSDAISKYCSPPAQFNLTWQLNEILCSNLPVRVIVNRRVSENQYRMGLIFINLSDQDKQLLEIILANL